MYIEMAPATLPICPRKVLYVVTLVTPDPGMGAAQVEPNPFMGELYIAPGSRGMTSLTVDTKLAMRIL